MKQVTEMPCGDKALREKTDRDWTDWKALLDDEGGHALAHRELAKLIHTHHEGGGWWSQMVAVGYERMIGRREVRQTCAGDFQAGVSKTLPVSDAEAHAWLANEEKRALWLDTPVSIRTATAPKSVRMGMPDHTIAAAWIVPRGDSKCSIGISHTKLADSDAVDEAKALWKAALERLAEKVGA